MLKLLVDWVDWNGDAASALAGAPVGVNETGVRVEVSREQGPGGGWPELAVFAESGQALWAWLVDVYGVEGDEASELAEGAQPV